MKKYIWSVFILCFFVWAVIVDNVVLPANNQLKQDVGVYTRYRVKEWHKGEKLNIIPDELMIYAVVKNREQLYYMEHKTYFENSLKNLPEGTPVQLRYARRFPKLWKRHLYALQERGIPIVRYSSAQLLQKQQQIWKFSGIMGSIFLGLTAVGWIGKPRQK